MDSDKKQTVVVIGFGNWGPNPARILRILED